MGNEAPKDNKEGQQEYERFGPVTVKEVNDSSADSLSNMQFNRLVESEKVLKTWLD